MYGVVSNVLVLPPMILCILLFKRSKNILKRKHRVDRGIEIGNITTIYDIYIYINPIFAILKLSINLEYMCSHFQAKEKNKINLPEDRYPGTTRETEYDER